MSVLPPDRFDPSLPPALLEAPQAFDAWAQEQLRIEQAESAPQAPLYHYTSDQGLKGILGSQRLRCFSHACQSDPNEFAFALMIARRVIREVGQTDDAPAHWFCACLDDMLETNGLASPFDFYLFSLSAHRNDARQWDEFGGGGRGFAIGFSPALFAPTETELREHANENVHIGRVVYGEDAVAARHRKVITQAASIASRVAHANRNTVRDVAPSVYFSAIAREVLASQLIWNCLTGKDSKFSNERETRCVILNIRERFEEFRRTLEPSGRTYIETPMPLKEGGNIVEVLVGPAAPLGAETTVSDFLRENGYSTTIAVTRATDAARTSGMGTTP